jgi:hypothetical protein
LRECGWPGCQRDNLTLASFSIDSNGVACCRHRQDERRRHDRPFRTRVRHRHAERGCRASVTRWLATLCHALMRARRIVSIRKGFVGERLERRLKRCARRGSRSRPASAHFLLCMGLFCEFCVLGVRIAGSPCGRSADSMPSPPIRLASWSTGLSLADGALWPGSDVTAGTRCGSRPSGGR